MKLPLQLLLQLQPSRSKRSLPASIQCWFPHSCFIRITLLLRKHIYIYIYLTSSTLSQATLQRKRTRQWWQGLLEATCLQGAFVGDTFLGLLFSPQLVVMIEVSTLSFVLCTCTFILLRNSYLRWWVWILEPELGADLDQKNWSNDQVALWGHFGVCTASFFWVSFDRKSL